MQSSDNGRAQSRVRPSRRDDLPALRTVIDSNGLFPGEMLDGMIAPFLAGGDTPDRWLTLEDATPYGLAYFVPERMTNGTWNLLLIAVRADRRGQGGGRALMAEAEAILAAEGQRVLLLETSGLAQFEATRAFYAGRGYQREAVIRDFYDAGEDKVVFWKSLTV